MPKTKKKKKTNKKKKESLFIKYVKEFVQWSFIIMTILIILGYYFWTTTQKKKPIFEKHNGKIPSVIISTEKNYGEKVEKYAHQFGLNASYLKALISLECSGRVHFKERFEPKVYTSLKNVRDKKTKKYGSIRYETIKDASDDALRNLASSWGPFQLMGYQSIELGVNVADIRGNNAVYWGIYWINKRYGTYLKKHKYKDAFHIHNTGRPMPWHGKSFTYDPNYINNGIKYINYFDLIKKK